jgi:hypothetical protein
MAPARPKRKTGPKDGAGLEERAMGFEPTTSSLGSWHSTPELRPRGYS